MLRPFPTLVVALLLVGQGLLATPGLWHRHADEGQPGPAAAAENRAGCHHHGHSDPADEPEPAHPAEDDDCAVCLALSTQRIELTAPPPTVASARLVGSLDAIQASAPVIADHGPPRSRGPPTFNCA